MNNFDVIIIGSGPAGNTAGIYLARAGIKTAMITGELIGGQLTTTSEVENWIGYDSILGSNLMSNIIQQSINCGVNVIYETVKSVDFSTRPFKCVLSNDKVYTSKYIIISTGANHKSLNIKGEAEFKGKGVSYCSICDGSFYKNKSVAVIGGGDSAGTNALYLSRLCEKVYLIHRRDEFRMNKNILEKCKNTKNIEIILNMNVTEIIGKNTVEKIKIETNDEIKEIILNGVFIAIGLEPTTSIFKNSSLNIDERGYIITKSDSGETNIEGVYAVGDVTNKLHKQAIIASGYGAISALEIQHKMEEK